jgi:hypothetical protein
MFTHCRVGMMFQLVEYLVSSGISESMFLKHMDVELLAVDQQRRHFIDSIATLAPTNDILEFLNCGFSSSLLHP